ncbi:hypothetical protein A2715_03640 [Candidatus Woesebacteria bacterium RIFCSPHIGHO2_01_FULL_39_32]|uniref:Uncharacterized protein n=1 Tax=Candidatus Woesebacteria bacterium RIFCSPLOWO2_01_FULL_39_25 TaxID=1802521 RepID=A0A1F8BLV7_9BACT|nr:MAG: hypothetical protein A2124_04945 [Candidatus Woesebacteria bacterium GWB1_37_5]OGM24833.1 MAG: hypothetical protein A2715_03640 [Candidatus Woesebacteria bacterium RIFCSPHIGHO2_01_FULL_39_32]OGM37154.1 MAG: hypothetical protein A3F01_05580 [Candidatus Woesebacteria bacterium RIFCSPHIGHO2_12_FULL_38_11]OGM64659.1 MAG: hypothetical protein A2893_06555 [Candidatus Woesebacteria bacterium RIFCSPLOWO2_01_FULL_39_25]
MNEIPDETLNLLQDPIFTEKGQLREQEKLKRSAEEILERVVSSASPENSKVVQFLTLAEALQKGEPVVFSDEEQGKTEVHMFTPLSSRLKPKEVIEKYDYNDRRWYQPDSLPPSHAAMVITKGKHIEGKSAQKLFVVVEPSGQVMCYHYGVFPSGKPEGFPTESEMEKNPTSVGFRTDNVYYKRENLDSENVKGILTAIARELDLNIPTNAQKFDKPITDYLPKYLGSSGEEISQSQ